MLYKESAIAVMIAAMLGAASLLGGLATPALATHDPDAVQIASEQISQEDNDSMIVDGVELTAKKSSSRSTGTLTIEVVQGDDRLSSGTLGTRDLQTTFTTVEVDIPAVNVTGDFEILVEYEGSGTITADGIDVIEGTEVAELPEEDPELPSTDDEEPSGEQPEVDNVIKTEALSIEDEETMTVEAVEFSAKKSSSRSTGTLTVAIVQNDEIRDSEQISTRSMQTTYTDFEVAFNEQVSDDFEVVFMYEGSGTISLDNINVPGTTEVAEDPDNTIDPNTPTDGDPQLTVEAVDQNGNKIPGLYVALLNAQNQLIDDGFTSLTFTLEADKTYKVEMGDFYNEETQTAYEFERWKDSSTDSMTRMANPAEFGEDNAETFTALYTVTENASPPVDDGNDGETTSPPPDSPSGTISVFAYRIPSQFWGPTFVSANANMYFVVYNSTGFIIETGYADETGTTIDGLSDGETYWVYPTDCDECHNDPHDVVFDHWEDGTTDRPRAVTPGHNVGAYYAYDPDP